MTYRVILCSEKFCALYRSGDVVTVPISAIRMDEFSPNVAAQPR